MPIYNSQLQKQNEIISKVAQNIGLKHVISGFSTNLKDYNAELSRYIWTINLMDLRNLES